MNRFALAFAFILASHVIAPLAASETLAIIGTGDVARALGPRFAELGHEVIYGSRNPASERAQALLKNTRGGRALLPAEAARPADILVLAVPAEVVVDVALSLGDLKGKIIIDPTN